MLEDFGYKGIEGSYWRTTYLKQTQAAFLAITYLNGLAQDTVTHSSEIHRISELRPMREGF